MVGYFWVPASADPFDVDRVNPRQYPKPFPELCNDTALVHRPQMSRLQQGTNKKESSSFGTAIRMYFCILITQFGSGPSTTITAIACIIIIWISSIE